MIDFNRNKDSTQLLRDKENALYNVRTRNHILQYPFVKQAVVLMAIIADAYTLFSAFDTIMTQNAIMTKVITGTVAAGMNLIPVLLAFNLRNPDLNAKWRKIICGILIGMFSLLFLSTFILRLSSGHEMFAAADTLDLGFSEEIATTDTDTSLTFGQVMVLVILGLSPLITSVISFVASFEISPEHKLRHINEMYRIDLQGAIDNQRTMLCELEADMAYDLEDNDNALYDALNATMDAQAEEAKVRSRRRLAEKVGSPEAVSYLLEEGYLTQQPERKESDEDSDYNGSIKFPA